jgi:hypothetical protein
MFISMLLIVFTLSTMNGYHAAPGPGLHAAAESENCKEETEAETRTGTETEAETRTGTETEAETEASSLKKPFTYIHDPKDNPGAMADIQVDPNAVYGFSPNPDSSRLGSYAQFDWTDPEYVKKAKKSREAYHESMESMIDLLYKMRADGASIEEIARAASTERNRIRLSTYKDDPAGLAAVKERNLKTYGHEDGPTPDELYDKVGSWEAVLQGAFSSNMGMDACCGLYDQYYSLYVELGLIK